MRKMTLLLFTLVALAGILNCAFIEPALAYEEETTHSESGEEDSECCFIHCSIHNQCLPSHSTPMPDNASLSFSFLHNPSASYHDIPSGSIFHPPLAR